MNVFKNNAYIVIESINCRWNNKFIIHFINKLGGNKHIFKIKQYIFHQQKVDISSVKDQLQRTVNYPGKHTLPRCL